MAIIGGDGNNAHTAVPLFDAVTPAGYISVVSAAEAWTGAGFGSWVEAIANIGTGKRLVGYVVASKHGNTVGFEIEIGEGAAASEAAILRDVFINPNYQYAFKVYTWKSLTNSARLSARVRDSSASALTYDLIPILDSV